MNSGLRSRRHRTDEEVNPLEGAINIVDAMLVFACGLMLALAIHWDVDLGLGQRVNLEQGQEVTDAPEIRDDLIETQGEGRLYEELGTVYKDPETGQLFMLTK
ncbi:DUF2149 domain-containing protein [Desulfoscipio gibsoniae]|uniref:DUF2149 domain-containing protein n=1 Tax=Desulfoscipio gibsoniae DSM 7213 TaxID=767817 RepID=R4KBD1_9FIRM|nr:DUF2149 domain-containing protein [Desulfoscipio gibsoniae]AGK99883.1 hypothetical protein Desgi_0298 [Desulfoscipio gibsoniae DSM 7213]